ncbi:MULTISPECIES: hypothetical protein [unclassified Clostridioides]|uniref:hypothetical protein n=1 Tax=unclassified Clostridioides TaxID=2635829 RepID=UPI001D0F523B|nr:hypothetical protein [Clostridioides sp. ZZV15-6388]MCC0643822.1 hypothetical protein [Clostridioides sp. ZZV14-6150]MCC0724393.1 hypothetical protein [Clostridioides sp. ZZV14-6104]MCC0724869.1 hypothetical protein [Clostridioides sp. ZZV14-6045]MCC0730759.1 hypothetical protein [Clostridioides sp. ZZV14-6048]MCC0736708.1 hypothetical protein [Clostridioides sp. ZZV14-6009]MCC0742124.1 hypothetical protein [Clostridioides sp. ZZV14-6044]MCC0752923.1 hypothetical protein [Clostridioides s
MENKNLKLTICIFAFVIGIIVLFCCIGLGQFSVERIMQQNGGTMDTNQYNIYLEQSISQYRNFGSILALLGGIGILFDKSARKY